MTKKINITSQSKGFTLLELVITCTVLAILSLGIMPLVKNGIKRQKEQELRVALREMRDAIDAFKRDTEGVNYTGLGGTPQNGFITPRSKVYIADGKIFTSENIDYYPPDLETLTKGVEVKPRVQGVPVPGIDLDKNATDKITQATKTYLRRIPDDPMTEGFAGTEEWNIQSCYQESDASSWDRINVFDVRSKSDEESLSGEKYSDW
ncbi:MAG: type II secretion system GspH family protein [Pyrinomonadaceae bacterium MAG19_C2-C3]|nr:type II secretion system GspH family protein [Pyrinomonadaceae bacterium MAG19_C2-C3]